MPNNLSRAGIWTDQVWKSVDEAAELQAQPFGLILDTGAYSATWDSVTNGMQAYAVLNSALTGGIYVTLSMAAYTGLLIALAAEPTTTYFSADP